MNVSLTVLAVKCNPDPQVLKLLAELGIGFDCASKAEIDQVLGLGVDPSRIIYAQPCKTNAYVRFAAKAGVKQMTFDNADELYKIKRLFPDAELLLRILTDDSASLCRLSLKFGAAIETARGLLELAVSLGLNVVGVAFHVGSGASDPQAFLRAVEDARHVFDQAAEVGYDLKTLDVGGGFCGDTFEEMAAVLTSALDEYFPTSVRIIGEPGRYYVSSAFTIACSVIARRTVDDAQLKTTSYMLYLNDGVYGNFSSIMFDHQHPTPRMLQAGNRFLYGKNARAADAEQGTQYSIWGPTCDGIDCIAESCTLPGVLDVGDWLYFEDMGGWWSHLFLPYKPMADAFQLTPNALPLDSMGSPIATTRSTSLASRAPRHCLACSLRGWCQRLMKRLTSLKCLSSLTTVTSRRSQDRQGT